MLEREIKKTVKINIDLESIPFLDTGYYFRPSNSNKLIKKQDLKYQREIMPGGVLASDVGSGKTITVIGLLSVGLNWDSKNDVSIKQKNNEIEMKLKNWDDDIDAVQEEEEEYKTS